LKDKCDCLDEKSCKEWRENDCKQCLEATRNVAVISTTMDDIYLFFTPLTAVIWKQRLDFHVACVVVGTHPQQSELHEFVLNQTLQAGVDIFWIESKPSIQDSTLSQISRYLFIIVYLILFSSVFINLSNHRLFIPFFYKQSDYLLTSDNDMWNIDWNHFHTRSSAALVQIFYSNAYDFKKPEIMFPICYIGMSASTWKTILKPHLINNNNNDNNNDDIIDLDSILIELLNAAKKQFGVYRWENSAKAISPQV
jgi:hypothetical protein